MKKASKPKKLGITRIQDKENIKLFLKRAWHFIWEEDSVWSWLANIVIAFVLIKFIVYPGLGFLLSTTHPIVAVVSSSMEHPSNFEKWWEQHKEFYKEYEITKEKFVQYNFPNGFNKGDIMLLKGVKPNNIKIGDVIVFNGGKSDPIIHRVINLWKENDVYYIQTKGDNNARSIAGLETRIKEDAIIGKAVFRVPLLGYIKIWFVQIIQLLVYR